MVLAGPGSGKTRVITHRIARLLERDVSAESILALTFTNKAAREMQERVKQLLGGQHVRVSTFHRFCSRLLRRFAPEVGLRSNFTILDRTDQVQIVRQIMKDEKLDSTFHDPGRVLSRISNARNEMMTADLFRRQFEQRSGNPLDAIVYTVFPEYESKVRGQNAVDFDDLLLHVVTLLEMNPEIREQLDQYFRFILVDEYQDTNLAQYRIVRALSQLHPNLCATGDPDQSIYGWRGARPANIAAFEQDFPGTRFVSLDQNFRSTQHIVRCADQLISNNRRPRRGRLTTENAEGTPVKLQVFENPESEADCIAAEIRDLVQSRQNRYGDFAIFYRVNTLSRVLETALSRHEIPYQVASGYSFFERTEIRDLLAYLRLIENESDDTALERILNRPARGIGNATLQKLKSRAAEQRVSLLQAARQGDKIPGISGRVRKSISEFVDLIERLNDQSADGKVARLLERIIDETGYLSLLSEDEDDIDADRQANIHELISAARQYDATADESATDAAELDAADDPRDRRNVAISGTDTDTGTESPSLQGFLELVMLSSEADSLDSGRGAVSLMTLHASKGLEFPSVYIVGLESGLIPHERAVRDGDPASFEEERRLLYVGITRARQNLTLTQSSERIYRGQYRTSISSPFLSELRGTLLQGDVNPSSEAVLAGRADDRLEEARRRFAAAQKVTGQPLVFSGAELASRQQRAADDHPRESAVTFRIGMLVRHPRYGRGVITSSSGGSGRGTITVEFENDHATHTFVASRCPLQPLGETD